MAHGKWRVKFDSNIQPLLQEIQDSVAALPVSAVPLVAAIVAMQPGMPSAIYALIMDWLDQRSDLSEVSPAAEALMHVLEYAKHRDVPLAQEEVRKQTQLLRALAQERQLFSAASFMQQLAVQLERLALRLSGVGGDGDGDGGVTARGRAA